LITLSFEGVREQDSEYNIAPKKEGVTGGRRKMCNKVVRDMYLLLNIICAIKRRRVSQVKPVACTGFESAKFYS
jgi:hypothetical protein